MSYPPDPGRLYHYTSGDALLSICSSHTLRASNIHYLNDSAEFQFGLETIHSKMKQVLDARGHDRYPSLWEAFEDVPRQIRHRHVVVFSLSEERDMLSQWRAYGKPGNGYCIGFSTERLRQIGEEEGFFLGKCVYPAKNDPDIPEVWAPVLDVLDGYDEVVDRGESRVAATTRALNKYRDHLSHIAPLFKNSHFVDEKEWRLIALKSTPDDKWGVRNGSSSLVPYCIIELGERHTSPIEELVIGPGPELPGIASMGAPWAFNANGLTGSIVPSKIPYRGW